MNSVHLIGRVVAKPSDQKVLSDERYRYMDVAVMRNFRDAQGQFTTETYRVGLWKGMANEVITLRKENDLVSIRGRLELRDGNVEIIAEMVEFLTT